MLMLMSRKDLSISCPCCQARLEVDLRTEKVVRWQRPEELDASGKPKVKASDWDSANTRVSTRLGGAEDKLDAALDRERTRGKDLDSLFEALKEGADEEEDADEE